MLLSDLFDQITYGELNQLSVAGLHTQGIQEQDYPKIIPHINLGMIEIYKRFDLKMEEVMVQQYEAITTYTLISKFAQTSIPADNTDPNPKIDGIPYYIIDSIYQPFTGNILRIETVYNELGQELYLNQQEANFFGPSSRQRNNVNYASTSNGITYQRPRYYSVHTPSYNSVQIPHPEKENQFSVAYRAAPSIIPVQGVDPKTYDVEVPISLLEALLLYIAARVNINRGTELGLAEGQAFMAKFEASINKVRELNLMNTDDTHNIKLNMKGWV